MRAWTAALIGLALLLVLFLGPGFAKRAEATNLVGGIAARNLIESPIIRGRPIPVAQQKPSECFSLLIAGPIDETRVEYKGLLSRKRGVDIALDALIARGWDQSSTNFGIIRVPWTGIVEQRVPDRNALSGRQKPNVIAGMVFRRVRFGNEVPFALWDVFDRVNFEVPISSKGRLLSGVDEGQLHVHWVADREDAVVRAIYSYPSPVGLDGRLSGVTDGHDNRHYAPNGGEYQNTSRSSQPKSESGYRLALSKPPLWYFAAVFGASCVCFLAGLIFFFGLQPTSPRYIQRQDIGFGLILVSILIAVVGCATGFSISWSSTDPAPSQERTGLISRDGLWNPFAEEQAAESWWLPCLKISKSSLNIFARRVA